MGPPLPTPGGDAPPTYPAPPPLLTPLYGGALAAAIPPACADVSAARPVPDHQEVFADAAADQSIVFEIVVRSV